MALLKDLTVFGVTTLINDTFVNHIYSNEFHHNTYDSNNYVLLGGGDAKALNLLNEDHNHNNGIGQTAWGQQYVNATGSFSSISGNMSGVGNITSSGNNTYSIGTSTNKWKEIYATTFYGALSGNASTATKLQTAYTINGTSFDGSANITTANWGTARNISIADGDSTNTGTAVSVNGSAAVTLKLPATIKATLTGNASTTTKLATAKTLWGQSFDGSANVSGNMSGVGNIVPSGNNTQNIGSSSHRWAKLYIGSNDTYGTSTQPIYWNSGVPTAITHSLNATLTQGVNNNLAYYSTSTNVTNASYLFYTSDFSNNQYYHSLWLGTTNIDNDEVDIGVRTKAGELYMFAQKGVSGGRGLYVPPKTVNNVTYPDRLVIYIDSTNNVTFQGYLNGTAANADKLNNYCAYNGNQWNGLKVLGSNGVIELGRYIDMHYIDNDSNDYSTRIQLASNPNPSNVLSLPTETGYLVTDIHCDGYVMKEYWVDYTGSNQDYYYPVIFDLSEHKKDNVRIEVCVALDSETIEGTGSTSLAAEAAAKPAWASHITTTESNGTYTTKRKFSCCAIWETTACGWGVQPIRRTIYAWDYTWCDGGNGKCPMANIGQLSNTSEEYILLRGGGKYRIRTSHGIIPVPKYDTYNSLQSQSVSPLEYDNEYLNVSGYSVYIPNNTAMDGTGELFGTNKGLFKYLDYDISNNNTLTIEIGGIRRTCQIGLNHTKIPTGDTTNTYIVGTRLTANGKLIQTYHLENFYYTGLGAYHTSDIRKKYDIRNILNEDVNKLFETENGFIRHFKWNDTNNDSYGFIAQELEEYCPEAIDFNNDTGYLAVNYNVAFSKIIGAMFKKIKELENKLKENGIS